MKTQQALAAAAAVFLGFFSAPCASYSQPVAAAIGLDVTAAIRTARFAEPLIATSPTTPAEDRALMQALARYDRRAQPDDVGALTQFLSQYPDSGWSPALLTNLGLIYVHYGYFSRALEAWEAAWRVGRNADEPQAKALVDRAVGELARLDASLGHMEKLSALFDEIGGRPISGSATEAVQAAREELALVKKDPRHLFTCGPTALRMMLLARGTPADKIDFLQWYRASLNGTNLAEVGSLADKAGFEHRLIFRKPGQQVPVPSIVHWKVGHFAAIIGEANGRFHIKDPVFAATDIWVTQAALDSEASGYFLVAADAAAESDWRPVGNAEALSIWGKGPTNQTIPGGLGDILANGAQPGCGMCTYDIKESAVGVILMDSPVGYTPPIGPSARVNITYNQREDSQPANFSFFNISQKWTLNWLSYVTDDPDNPGASVSRYLSGGGAAFYSGYNPATGQFSAQFDDGSVLVLASQSPISYRRQLRDGSVEIYAQSNGSASFPRNILLSQIIDPQGNALTLNYDGQLRLLSLTDATGRQTTFTYGLAARPLLITRITDPFGRSATLGYDNSGRLTSITDVIGLTSSFTYDANSLVNTLTTAYGTTSFAYTAPGTSGPPRFVQVTDPMGFNEREEWLEPAPIPDSDPAATIPQGMPLTPVNQYLTYRNSFHWDKAAYVAAGCTPTGGCDYAKARDRHFTHVANGSSIKSTALESVKNPLENRIWYQYPGQSNSINGGTYNHAIAAGRVLDDGTTQLYQYAYDTTGHFNLTRIVDPVGRTTTFAYANKVDLAAIAQTTAFGAGTTIAQFTYNTHHRPVLSTDAAGQTTTYSYNAAGQVISVTNPLNQTTQYQYDPLGRLTTIINANNVAAESFTYDTFDRVATSTDSEGWTATYSYDNLDRVTKITYPDQTSDIYIYDKLDLFSYRDRQNRLWTYNHDADRRLRSVIDPLGQQNQLGYDNAGRLTSLTDPKNNVTSWVYDVQGRVTSKIYADNSTLGYIYENTTSRLKSTIDALGQTRQISYGRDDRVNGITYLNAVNQTPNVTFAYDPYFPRLVSMVDGNGPTQYSYVPVGTEGALHVRQESSSVPNSEITYAYDQLNRVVSRTVAGAGAEIIQYDTLGRVTGHTSDLGAFGLTYLGQTRQVAQRQLLSIGSNLVTNWTYLNNAGDRRLAAINNVGLSSGQFSTFQFSTTPGNFINSITESSDISSVYPGALQQTAVYNNLNQLTSLSGQPMIYDLDGNLLSDGQRTYAWDAENRLVSIAYPAQPGKLTSFAYDGISRRTAITSTPPSGSAATVSYIWCESRLCQARDASNNTLIREYLAEGEFVSGSSPSSLYYGIDQIGSTRRVFVTTSSAPAFTYDAYGNALQLAAPLTDFGYGGMFYNADSGLYLTQSRAYDPTIGRWLSRDPRQFLNDTLANVYGYASANPVSFVDQSGLSINPVILSPAAGQAASPPIAPTPGPVANSSRSDPLNCIPGIQPGPQLAQGFPIPFIFEDAPLFIEPPLEEFPVNPGVPPGPDFIWRGQPGSTPGGPNGNWYNPKTGESLRPDLEHPEPIGPHWDYRAPNGAWYRWFRNGTVELKS